MTRFTAQELYERIRILWPTLGATEAEEIALAVCATKKLDGLRLDEVALSEGLSSAERLYYLMRIPYDSEITRRGYLSLAE